MAGQAYFCRSGASLCGLYVRNRAVFRRFAGVGCPFNVRNGAVSGFGLVFAASQCARWGGVLPGSGLSVGFNVRNRAG
jgi:hypothetical protein